MSALRRDLTEAIEKLLRSHGVTTWTVDKRSGHMKYRFVFDGHERLFVTAGSPSDNRGFLNALTDLRLVMGVKREVHKNAANRTKPYRKRVQKLPDMPKVTPGRDMWAALAHVKATPHHQPLGRNCYALDTAARGLADAILGVAP